jgi:hypothetical protein
MYNEAMLCKKININNKNIIDAKLHGRKTTCLLDEVQIRIFRPPL